LTSVLILHHAACGFREVWLSEQKIKPVSLPYVLYILGPYMTYSFRFSNIVYKVNGREKLTKWAERLDTFLQQLWDEKPKGTFWACTNNFLFCWIFYLHFKCYPFSGFPSWNPLSHSPSTCFYEGAPPPTPASPPWHFPTLGHQPFTGPRASPPTNVWQGHPLLLMHMAGAVGSSTCTFWLVVYSLGALGALVGWYCCSSYGLQTPSAQLVPSVLSLTPPLQTLCSIQWLAVSICLCICQTLAEPLRRQLYQVPVSKHFLASAILSGFGVCISDGFPGGAVSGRPFIQSLLHTLSRYFLPWVFCSPV